MPDADADDGLQYRCQILQPPPTLTRQPLVPAAKNRNAITVMNPVSANKREVGALIIDAEPRKCQLGPPHNCFGRRRLRRILASGLGRPRPTRRGGLGRHRRCPGLEPLQPTVTRCVRPLARGRADPRPTRLSRRGSTGARGRPKRQPCTASRAGRPLLMACTWATLAATLVFLARYRPAA